LENFGVPTKFLMMTQKEKEKISGKILKSFTEKFYKVDDFKNLF
jgi:hypothetical protein